VSGKHPTVDFPFVPEPSPADPTPSSRAAKGPTEVAPTYGAYYYAHDCGEPYERTDNWLAFFGAIADRIVRELRPKRVLDAGCAKGFLVEELRKRGVEAFGIDVSEYAISKVHESVAGFCSMGSLTDPFDGRYDLITCVEVVEHMPATDAAVAISHMTDATDRLLLSTSPFDYAEPTHVNVQPPEQWSALLASRDFVRDLDYDATYLTPWASLYRRSDAPLPEIVRAYDRSWWRLRHEVHETRTRLVEIQNELEKLSAAAEGVDVRTLTDEREQLRKEVLRLRDAAIGHEAELATAKGRVEELSTQVERLASTEDRLNEVLGSTSWRLTQAAGAPLRKLRERRG
jgi:SAM-dependent methyltransferase